MVWFSLREYPEYNCICERSRIRIPVRPFIFWNFLVAFEISRSCCCGIFDLDKLNLPWEVSWHDRRGVRWWPVQCEKYLCRLQSWILRRLQLMSTSLRRLQLPRSWWPYNLRRGVIRMDIWQINGGDHVRIQLLWELSVLMCFTVNCFFLNESNIHPASAGSVPERPEHLFAQKIKAEVDCRYCIIMDRYMRSGAGSWTLIEAITPTGRPDQIWLISTASCSHVL